MRDKKLIELKFVDWDCDMNEENFANNGLMKLLQKHLGDKYEFKFSNNPKYLFYSTYSDSHFDYDKDCMRICIAFENIYIDWNLADYGISTHIMDFGERNLTYPHYLLYQYDVKLALKKHLLCDTREKFCAFMVSNGGADGIRDEFFEKLCEYKKVDSGGRWKNNIGGPIGDRWSDFSTSKREWLKGYKFNLCFENSSNKGYTTEKILQAFAAGCIPIYWGDESLCDEKYADIRPVFNQKAFINVHNFDSIQSAIREIQRIDNDESAYNAMRSEPIFCNDALKKFLNVDGGGDLWNPQNIDSTIESVINKSEIMLVEFFDNIFEKDEKQIKYGQHLYSYVHQRIYDRRLRLKHQNIRRLLRQIEDIFSYIPKKIRNLFRKMVHKISANS